MIVIHQLQNNFYGTQCWADSTVDEGELLSGLFTFPTNPPVNALVYSVVNLKGFFLSLPIKLKCFPQLDSKTHH